ncbi:uncharacterized protein LOC117639439 [Thrips palmi]|uniref:Uncharacterized protein LOC117639439 n=1 Tax=Thrips palmi TaxID=161013 RepID=A0A6P8YB17_THRPL|nr:uncharacterized protein LOC117639439 [Thrips palmi]
MPSVLYREEERDVYGNEASEERRTLLSKLVDVVYKFSRDESSKGYNKFVTWKLISQRIFGPWSTVSGEEVENIWRRVRDRFDEEVLKEKSSYPRTNRKQSDWFLYEKLSFWKEQHAKTATSGRSDQQSLSPPTSPFSSSIPSPSPSPSVSLTSSRSASPPPKRGRYASSEMEDSFEDPYFEPIGDPDYESDDVHSDDESEDSHYCEMLQKMTESMNTLTSAMQRYLNSTTAQQPQPSGVPLSSSVKAHAAVIESALSKVPEEKMLQCFTEVMQVICKFHAGSTSS